MAKLPQQPLPRLGQGFRVPPAAGGGVAGRLAAVLEIQARVRRYIAHAALGHRQSITSTEPLPGTTIAPYRPLPKETVSRTGS